MYAYNSIYGDSMHRRRRTTGWEDAIYCIVLAEGANHGAFMECGNCYYYYGVALSCSSSNLARQNVFLRRARCESGSKSTKRVSYVCVQLCQRMSDALH